MKMLYKGIGIILLFVVNTVLAQHQNDNWIMGSGAGFNFTNGSVQANPVGTFPFGIGLGPAASYSDPTTGNLVFYTDGFEVYNYQHQIIENGQSITEGLLYGPSLIVPYPGKANLFYIFVFTGRSSPISEGVLSYSIVDMNLNGGLGKVIEEDTYLGNRFTSGFIAVRQLYDQGWWLVTHLMSSDTFYSYRIEENGIEQNPVISVIPWKNSPVFIPEATMKSSSDGKQIFYSDGRIYLSNEVSHSGLFNFDKKCGLMSLQEEFSYDSLEVEDAAFSLSNRMLYITWKDKLSWKNNRLIQYDLSQSDPYASGFIINMDTIYRHNMQLAPNGKIYISDFIISGQTNPATLSVSVINNPDIVGSACDFKSQFYNLNPDKLYSKYITLPTFITNWIQDTGYSFPKIIKKDPCILNNTLLYAEKGLLADSIVWDLGDGATSREQAVAHDYADTGTYPITLHWYSCNRGYEIKDSITISPKVNLRLDADTTVCKGTAYAIRLNDTLDEYRWSTGDSIGSITAFNAGTYVLQARRGLCWVKDSIEIKNYPDIWTSLGDEYYICNDAKELVRLDAGEGFQSYRWNPTGDTTQWIEVMDLGDYFVVVKDLHGCGGNDGTKVKRRCPAKVYYPNAFTPNGDGLNDDYKPVGVDIISFHMEIYNRWGDLMFETNDINRTWDGKRKGVQACADVYFYQSSYSGYFNKRINYFEAKGNVSLIR